MNRRLSHEKCYQAVVKVTEDFLARYGDTPLGVGYTRPEHSATYRIMLEVIRDWSRPSTILDVGCGTSRLYEFLLSNNLHNLEYTGLDLSPVALEISRAKYPNITYYDLNLLDEGNTIPPYDYVIMNGLFTWKGTVAFDDMFAYLRDMVRAAYAKARVALAFNLVSKHVDWERDDLFHLPFDSLAGFLKHEITERYTFRCDYGAHHYTTYVYR
ncbi:MAG: SAM-dependent methyltransferase [Terriglobia bacterium]|nr:MAG: SAM-dependent methyltransferase [Terriglobia bacterium]